MSRKGVTSVTSVTELPDGRLVRCYSVGPCGHLYTRIDGELQIVSRLVWKMVHGQEPKGRIFFRDGDVKNVSPENLMIEVVSRKTIERIRRAKDPVKFGDRIVERSTGEVLAKGYDRMFRAGLISGFFPVILHI